MISPLDQLSCVTDKQTDSACRPAFFSDWSVLLEDVPFHKQQQHIFKQHLNQVKVKVK